MRVPRYRLQHSDQHDQRAVTHCGSVLPVRTVEEPAARRGSGRSHAEGGHRYQLNGAMLYHRRLREDHRRERCWQYLQCSANDSVKHVNFDTNTCINVSNT